MMMVIGLLDGIRGAAETASEGAELVPVVAAGEDTAEAEDDDKQKRRPQREPQHRPGGKVCRRRHVPGVHCTYTLQIFFSWIGVLLS